MMLHMIFSFFSKVLRVKSNYYLIYIQLILSYLHSTYIILFTFNLYALKIQVIHFLNWVE